MENRREKRDFVARIMGGIVFALGIAILIISFICAYKLFNAAGLIVEPGKEGGPTAAAVLGQSALSMIIRIGALFIMVLAGSIIAGRGVQMYFVCDRPPKIED